MRDNIKLNSKKSETIPGNLISRKAGKRLFQTKNKNSPVDHILHLQRTMGNRAVTRLFQSGAIQARLTIGKPNDIYEKEADSVADRVMSMPEPKRSLVKGHSSLAQRQSTCPECLEKKEIQTKPLAEQITPLVQRQAAEEEEVQTKLQRQATEEEEEPVQAKLLQRQESEEEEAQTKLQRQAVGEEEEPVQAKLLQRQGTEEEEETVQTKLIQRQAEEEEGQANSSTALLTPHRRCLPTVFSGRSRLSVEDFLVYFRKDNTNRGEITLHQREDSDRALHTESFSEGSTQGRVTFPAGIPINNENHHYELDMVFYNSRGVRYGGMGRNRPVLQFEICRLLPAPTGVNLDFASMLYAEGRDEGEFPYIRDLVYNRIEWVANCPGDARDFGTDVRSVLIAPNQFDSVLSNTTAFQVVRNELNNHSGPCKYTTPPRSTSPNTCRRVNAAIQTVNNGNGNTHNYIFFRSDTRRPSTRAANRWRYKNGNYYWEITGCPPDRR